MMMLTMMLLRSTSPSLAIVGRRFVTTRPVFLGGTAVDMTFKLHPSTSDFMFTSTPSSFRTSIGGVARNAALACHDTSHCHTTANPLLISPLGEDTFARQVHAETSRLGLASSFIVSRVAATPIYNAVLDSSGSLIVGCAAMDLHRHPEVTHQLRQRIQSELDRNSSECPSVVCVDANLDPGLTRDVFKWARQNAVVSVFEVTSVEKGVQVWKGIGEEDAYPCIITPNTEELLALAKVTRPTLGSSFINTTTTKWDYKHVDEAGTQRVLHTSQQRHSTVLKSEWIEALHVLVRRVECVLLKLGKHGVALAFLDSTNNDNTGTDNTRKTPCLQVWHYAPANIKVTNVTGAGDTLVGTFISGLHQLLQQHQVQHPNIPDRPAADNAHGAHDQTMGKLSEMVLRREQDVHRMMVHARRCAEMTCQVDEAVHPDLPKLIIGRPNS